MRGKRGGRASKGWQCMPCGDGTKTIIAEGIKRKTNQTCNCAAHIFHVEPRSTKRKRRAFQMREHTIWILANGRTMVEIAWNGGQIGCGEHDINFAFFSFFSLCAGRADIDCTKCIVCYQIFNYKILFSYLIISFLHINKRANKFERSLRVRILWTEWNVVIRFWLDEWPHALFFFSLSFSFHLLPHWKCP